MPLSNTEKMLAGELNLANNPELDGERRATQQRRQPRRASRYARPRHPRPDRPFAGVIAVETQSRRRNSVGVRPACRKIACKVPGGRSRR